MARNRTLVGTVGADTIAGHGGDDVIFGHQERDTSGTAGAINAVRVGTGLDGAVFAGSAPGDPDHLFVVKKDTGEIYRLDPATGAKTLFLDIPNGEFTSGGEQGLLGLAFHPDYASNGRFFVHLVNAAGDIEIREYARSGNPLVADQTPTQTLLTVAHQPQANHNGGALAFSPKDGTLYIALGDGGTGGANGQNKDVLLGKILRLDVNGDDFPADSGRNYAIPDDNPFVGTAGADEVWAYGLRNPWRIGFDALTGDLYIGDVGQSTREEIDFQPASDPGGRNYGWNLAEGTVGTPPPGSILPIFDYGRDKGASVTGGLVYRGDGPALNGAYFFADFISGRLWTLEVVDGKAVGVTERTSQVVAAVGSFGLVSSFGSDGKGNLYVVSLNGDIFRLDMTKLAGDLGDDLSGGRGSDTIYGGAGDDRLAGGRDGDLLSGGFGDDTMLGGRGGDRMHGDGGADRMEGGPGGDSYRVDDAGDTIVEAAGGGRDSVTSLVSLTLAENVERLELAGVEAISGTGNDTANALVGNGAGNVLDGQGGNDILRGKAGDDTLIASDGRDHLFGGAGADAFLFGLAGDTHADRIADFGEGDRIQLDDAIFTGAGPVGALASAVFFRGASAADPDDRIGYNPETGGLVYDANGDGAGGRIKLAILDKALDLSAGDIFVV